MSKLRQITMLFGTALSLSIITSTAFASQTNTKIETTAIDPKFQIGQVVTYIPDTAKYVLKNAPTTDNGTTTSIATPTTPYAKNRVIVLGKYINKANQTYYRIRLNDNDQGWVLASHLTKTTNTNHTASEIKNANTDALIYINQLRTQNGASTLKRNPKLSQLANARTKQLQHNFAKYNLNGKNYTNSLAKKLNITTKPKLKDVIMSVPSRNTPQEALVQAVNNLVYDSDQSSTQNEPHGFLNKNINEIGISIRAYHGYYYISFNFR